MTRAIMLALALGPLLAENGWAQPSRTPGLPEIGMEQRLNEQVPLDLEFVNEQGQSVRLRDYFDGRPVVLVLAYYRCPRLCSLVLNTLADSLNRLDYEVGKEFTVVTVSFDHRETPELAAAKKATYAGYYNRPGAAAGWHFLTGQEGPIRRLADAVGFRFAYDPGKDQYAHSSGIMVLTPGGKVARYFFGLDYPARDLRFGLEDASEGKVGSPVAQPLRLLCFAYDPVTGRYTVMTMRLVRVAGAATVLVGGIVLWIVWRRERARATMTPAG